MKAREMDVGSRDQNAQAFEQFQRLEGQGLGAVGPRVAEGIEHSTVRELGEALLSQRRPGDVTAQMLQPLAIGSGHAHISVQGVAIEVGTA